MALLQKAIACIGPFLLVSVFVSSASSVISSEETSEKTVHQTGNNTVQKIDRQLKFQMEVHGFMLWASVGLLTPVGVVLMRMSHRVECRRRLKTLFYFHAVLEVRSFLLFVVPSMLFMIFPMIVHCKALMDSLLIWIEIVSVLLATVGAIMALKNFENKFNNTHQRIGLAIYALIWLQPLIGLCRPQRGIKGRSSWYFLHWLLGTGTSLLGFINVYTGLYAYRSRTSNNVSMWVILLTAEVSFISFLYLLQDRWDYLQKQSTVLGEEEPIRPTYQVSSLRNKTGGACS